MDPRYAEFVVVEAKALKVVLDYRGLSIRRENGNRVETSLIDGRSGSDEIATVLHFSAFVAQQHHDERGGQHAIFDYDAGIQLCEDGSIETF